MKAKFREIEIFSMSLIVEGIKDNIIAYISNLDSTQEIWKDTPFKNACSQEEVIIYLVRTRIVKK